MCCNKIKLLINFSGNRGFSLEVVSIQKVLGSHFSVVLMPHNGV